MILNEMQEFRVGCPWWVGAVVALENNSCQTTISQIKRSFTAASNVIYFIYPVIYII